MDKIEVGDVVLLKGGGILMTVNGVAGEGENRYAVCVWMGEDDNPHSEKYNLRALREKVAENK